MFLFLIIVCTFLNYGESAGRMSAKPYDASEGKQRLCAGTAESISCVSYCSGYRLKAAPIALYQELLLTTHEHEFMNVTCKLEVA